MVLWTPEHAQTLLPALAIMLVVAFVLRLTIGKKSLKIRMIPFQILAVAIFLLEIGKQVLSYQRGYDLYHIPLHFCSLFIFALPVMAFYRGKHQTRVFQVVTVLCMAMTMLMLIYPDLIYSAGNITGYWEDYFNFHTVTFHNIVMFELILIFALDLNEGESGSPVLALTVVVGIFCVISAVMAQILETNYANFYHCNVPPVEELRLYLQTVLGYVLTQIIYVVILSALNWGFVMLAYGAYKLLRKLLPSKTPAVI